jgi:hypothetical protein
VAASRAFILVSALRDLYVPLQDIVFANLYYSRVWSHNGVTSFNIRLI